MSAPNRGNVSPFVARCLSERLPLAVPIAADIGCGVGRHLALLSGQCVTVVALDIDLAALRSAKQQCRAVLPLLCDLRQGLPFKAGSLGLALAVHVPLLMLVPMLADALAPRGFAILESVGAQGGNWQDLPRRGAVRRKLSAHFTILDLEERPAGPQEKHKVAVRALVRRNP